MLYKRLRAKRRTPLSSVLAVSDNAKYDFELEREVGVEEPSEEEMISILLEICDISPQSPPCVLGEKETTGVSILSSHLLDLTEFELRLYPDT